MSKVERWRLPCVTHTDPQKYTGGKDESKDGIPLRMERSNPITALARWSIRQEVKATSHKCKRKPYGGEM